MLKGQVGDEGGLAVEALVVHAAGLHVTAREELAAGLIDLLGEVLEVVVRALIDDRPDVGRPLCRIADDEFVGHLLEATNQLVVDRLFHQDPRGR